MFDTRTKLFFFACLKDAAGAILKSAAPAPGSDQQKNWLRLQRLRLLAPAPQHWYVQYMYNLVKYGKARIRIPSMDPDPGG